MYDKPDMIRKIIGDCPLCHNIKAYFSGYYKKYRCIKCGYGNREYETLMVEK